MVVVILDDVLSRSLSCFKLLARTCVIRVVSARCLSSRYREDTSAQRVASGMHLSMGILLGSVVRGARRTRQVRALHGVVLVEGRWVAMRTASSALGEIYKKRTSVIEKCRTSPPKCAFEHGDL